MPARIATSTLRQIVSLQNLSTFTLDALSECSGTRRYQTGEIIVGHLANSRDFYIIVSGKVRVKLAAPNGRLLTYQLLAAGEMFGELSAIDGHPRTASVVAENECVLVEMSRENMRKLMEVHSEFAMVIVYKLIRSNRWLTKKLFEYHSYNVKGRVYSEILRLTNDDPDSTVIITDRDLASRVGTTRENVTRIHSKLKKGCLIERHHSTLRILDRAGIEQLLPDCEFN